MSPFLILSFAFVVGCCFCFCSWFCLWFCPFAGLAGAKPCGARRAERLGRSAGQGQRRAPGGQLARQVSSDGRVSRGLPPRVFGRGHPGAFRRRGWHTGLFSQRLGIFRPRAGRDLLPRYGAPSILDAHSANRPVGHQLIQRFEFDIAPVPGRSAFRKDVPSRPPSSTASPITCIAFQVVNVPAAWKHPERNPGMLRSMAYSTIQPSGSLGIRGAA